ncbi:MFS transporter [Polaromonas sp. JS666]|uniref:MFS transporter n=1 Tax=Polaromonas sp. (strain JS666 / ATCC BAA-500) TaxID=296591 RepID=UPI0000464AB4|nr:MFS transporter [Polaromonas sp. JS666]ABE45304.1 major facilitator superfamily MFS_1 [Polaromonas sp. JS666]
MQFLVFLRDNARWLGGGFLLFFFSSFGQTFLISLSAGDIRLEYGLSHGGFGSLYMAATLASAFTLPRLGHLADHHSAKKLALVMLPMLALAAAGMALSHHVVTLFVTIYLLRLLGQGMMSHLAFTTMARWFSAQRGRAISLATLGLNTGEAVLPLAFVALAASLGWRNTWWLAAGALVLVALPLIATLVSVERAPKASDPVARVTTARDWSRSEVLRDPLFYAVMLAMVPPAFIGNTIFFHQVYLVELRGWSLTAFASSFTLYALMTIAFTLISGQLIDRVGGLRLLPFYLLPLGLALLLLGSVQAAWSMFAFMALYGVSNGFSLSLYGSLWPELYGLRNLGAIRAVILSMLVFASAAGPGLGGLLIDAGVSYPALIVGLGVYCVVISMVMLRVTRRLRARA